MNLLTKPWPTIYCQFRMVPNTRKCEIPSNSLPEFMDFLRYKFQSSIGAYEDKTATLSDSDSVWTEVRHMHMRETIDKLMADFNKFIQDNAGFKGYVESRDVYIALTKIPSRREGAASLNDMKDMLANLPQYQEQREKVVSSPYSYCIWLFNNCHSSRYI